MKERVRLELGMRSLGRAPDSLRQDESRAYRDVLERTAEHTETQEQLLTLQEEKRTFVHGLNSWRKKFWLDVGDNAEEQHRARESFSTFENQPGARTLRELPSGMFETTYEDGTNELLTKGEVYAAHEWGVWWKFDDSVSNETQLSVMKHQARAHIAEKYDAQLIAFGGSDSSKSEGKRAMYHDVAESRASLQNMPAGLIAEKMLVSFLTKQMRDGTRRFRVERATAFDDIERGIDFFVVVEDVVKGVTVAEPVHRVGIQFTTSKNHKVLERKQEQVKELNRNLDATIADELLLVTIPIDDINRDFGKWRMNSDGTPKAIGQLDPRGPDHAWSSAVKNDVLDNVVGTIYHTQDN